MIIKTKKQWRNYTKEDYRIEEYCKKECPDCSISKNGQAFCWGKFTALKPELKNYQGGGCECTTSINICFDENYQQEPRWWQKYMKRGKE